MAEQSASERTEQPTGKKLGKARSQGQVTQSEEFTSFVSILVLVTMLSFQGSSICQWCTAQLVEGMACDTSAFTNSQTFSTFLNAKIADCLIVILPICAALCVGSIAANIVVGGLNYSPSAIKLDFGALSPAAGLGKMVNVRSMVKLLMSIIKLIFISAIAYFYLKGKLEAFAILRWAWSFALLSAIGKLILGLMIRICIGLLVIAVADTVFQKWKYIEDLKMTKQEVKEELRQTEGSPEVHKQIRKMQVQAYLRRMRVEVPKASVVLTNPTHVAVALRYDPKKGGAPILVAKGAEHMAEKIKEIARAYGVPIIRKPPLARAIFSTVKVDGVIPETLYVAVAEVLAMIFRLRQRR